MAENRDQGNPGGGQQGGRGNPSGASQGGKPQSGKQPSGMQDREQQGQIPGRSGGSVNDEGESGMGRGQNLADEDVGDEDQTGGGGSMGIWPGI